MRNLDLAAELGAKTFVLWGGREGAEYDAAKDIRAALDRYREGIDTARRSTSSTGATTSGSPSSPSRTSRAATSCCRRSGTRWRSSTTSSTRDGRPQPRGRARADGRPELRARHRAGAVAGQAVPHRPQRPARPSSTRTSSSATATCSTRSSSSTCSRTAGPGGGPAYDGPRHFDYKPLRTEDIDGVWDSAAANMRTYLLLKERARRSAPTRGAGGHGRQRVGPARAADPRRGRDLRRPARRPRRSRTSTPTPTGGRGTASSSSTSWPSSTCSAPADADARTRRRRRLVDPVVQGRGPRRRHRCAGAAGSGSRTRTAPRSTRRVVGGASSAIAEAGGLDDVAADRRRRAAARHGALDADGEVVRDALLWNDTRSRAGGDRPRRRRARRGRCGPEADRLGPGRVVHRHQAALARRRTSRRTRLARRGVACRTTGSPGASRGARSRHGRQRLRRSGSARDLATSSCRSARAARCSRCPTSPTPTRRARSPASPTRPAASCRSSPR
jgi:hypothetical protein